MKISKLFHWLYAFLMLLPVFFVLGKGLYVTFNPNAKDSYYGETINETNYINTDYSNFVENARYYVSTRSLGSNLGFNVNRIDLSIQFYLEEELFDYPQLNVNTNYYLGVYWPTSGTGSFQISDGIGTDTLNGIIGNKISLPLSYSFQCICIYLLNNTQLDLKNYSILERIEYNKYSYLDNAIDYGMSELNESSLFAWAKDSFLVSPFVYITDLFGMPSNSPIIVCLSYWIDISIIWLTFDLLMYVPLLVHRWLDKGVLE